jgi:hypothetical protein
VVFLGYLKIFLTTDFHGLARIYLATEDAESAEVSSARNIRKRKGKSRYPAKAQRCKERMKERLILFVFKRRKEEGKVPRHGRIPPEADLRL